MHAVLALILTFFSTACLWLLLQAEFLGIVLVLVYVGAVMILFLFVVMMLDMNMTPIREGFARYFPVAMVVAAVMLFEMVGVDRRQGQPGGVGPVGNRSGRRRRPEQHASGSARRCSPVSCCRSRSRQ